MDVVLLANLAQRPSHGYELRRRVEESSGFALSNNSLYPALRRFSEAGAVHKAAEELPGRPPRHVYTITDVGRELLHDMLADLPGELAGDEAEFLARLSHFGWLEPGEQAQVLHARRRALVSRHDRVAALGEAQEEGTWHRVALDEVTRRVRSELRWLDGVLAQVEDAGPAAHPAGPAPHPAAPAHRTEHDPRSTGNAPPEGDHAPPEGEEEPHERRTRS